MANADMTVTVAEGKIDGDAILVELRSLKALMERLVVFFEIVCRPSDLPPEVAEQLTQAWSRVATAAPVFPAEEQQAAEAAFRCAAERLVDLGASSTCPTVDPGSSKASA
jgi:hypothetical protein